MTFSALKDTDFFGRQDQLAGLVRRVSPGTTGVERSAVLIGSRGIGKTELLRQLFGRLFWRQDRIAPFYFAVNPALLSAATFAKAYFARFLCQRLGFEKKEQSLAYREESSLDGLFSLADERDARWARELLDRFRRIAADPVNALRMAIATPHLSSLSSGIPVVVLIDEFHRLQGLHVDGTPDPRLASLFETPLSFSNTPHIVTGCATELQEMPVLGDLEHLPVEPLGYEAASARALFLLKAYEIEGAVPPALVRRLGGNPFYLGCVVRTLEGKKNPDEMEFWNAYIQEVMEGTLAVSWSSALKRHFPDLELRRVALAIAYKIYHANEALSCSRIATSFNLTNSGAEAVMHTLYLAGVIDGEFGLFRAPEDQVLGDIIDCLYRREFLATSSRNLSREFLEKLLTDKRAPVRFEMALPMTMEAELVAAHCLEQIGKNLKIGQDAVGQLQIALIEACINAREHSQATSDEILVSVAFDDGRLEVAIESAGHEFILQETSEPVGDGDASATPKKGWGIKLMRRFVDDVRFEKTARGIKTVLVKNLEKTSKPKADGGAHDRTGGE